MVKQQQEESYGRYGIADFPRSEHQKRVSKAQRLMRSRAIDCLVLTSETNIGYFSGYRGTANVESVDYSTAFLVLPADATPTLVTHVSSRGNVEGMLALGRAEYVYWERVNAEKKHSTRILDSVSNVIREVRPSGPTTIGLEMGQRLHIGSSLELINELRRTFAQSQFVDASDIVWNCRKIKSDLEIKYLEKACKITLASYEETFAKVREGMTEKEVAREVYKGILEGGGEDMPLKMFLNIRAGPERYTMCDTRPTERRLKKGDILILDGGFMYHGYFSDLTRLLCVGRPSQKQLELFQTARDAEEIGVKMLKAGARTGDIWKVVMQLIRERDHIKNSLFEGIGHGIGLDIHENPRIASNSEDLLEPGMVLTMEPCLYDEPVVEGILSGMKKRRFGKGVFFVEDEVLITDSGSRLLSKMSRDLYIA